MITFRRLEDARGVLIECEIGGVIGRARVTSAGEEEAKVRARAQCEQLAVGEAIRLWAHA
jgi:hypothetical protein